MTNGKRAEEIGAKFRNEFIIFYSDALPTNPAWKITEGRKQYVWKYRENWRFGWRVRSRARNEYISWNVFSRNRSQYISAKQFSNTPIWCSARFYWTRRVFQDGNDWKSLIKSGVGRNERNETAVGRKLRDAKELGGWEIDRNNYRRIFRSSISWRRRHRPCLFAIKVAQSIP